MITSCSSTRCERRWKTCVGSMASNGQTCRHWCARLPPLHFSQSDLPEHGSCLHVSAQWSTNFFQSKCCARRTRGGITQGMSIAVARFLHCRAGEQGVKKCSM